jgi:hypothetical protein
MRILDSILRNASIAADRSTDLLALTIDSTTNMPRLVWLPLVMSCAAGCATEPDVSQTSVARDTSGETTDPTTGTHASSDLTTSDVELSCDDPEAAVATIIAQSCALATCHDDDAAAGLNLGGDWPSQLIAQSSSLCDGAILVVPGDPEASHVYLKVATMPQCGERMPVGDVLDAAAIDCIGAWIEGLAPATCEACGGNTCIDLQSNAQHCGGCDVACPPGIGCVDGQCECPNPTTACDGACVDTAADGEHCGGCGQTCDAGLVCLLGDCAADCGALTLCGGGCVDPQSNPQHCGACDSPCPVGAECVEGTCVCAGEDVSFTNDVAPILSANCTAMGCHGFPIPQEGLDLRTGMAYADLVGVPSAQCDDRLRVAPGDAANSYLLDKILGVDLCFGTQMPKDPPPLTAAQIDLIARWICQGALEDGQ